MRLNLQSYVSIYLLYITLRSLVENITMPFLLVNLFFETLQNPRRLELKDVTCF